MASFLSLRLAVNHELPHNQYVYATIAGSLASAEMVQRTNQVALGREMRVSSLVSSRHTRNAFLSKGSRSTEEFRRQDPEALQQQIRGRW